MLVFTPTPARYLRRISIANVFLLDLSRFVGSFYENFTLSGLFSRHMQGQNIHVTFVVNKYCEYMCLVIWYYYDHKTHNSSALFLRHTQIHVKIGDQKSNTWYCSVWSMNSTEWEATHTKQKEYTSSNQRRVESDRFSALSMDKTLSLIYCRSCCVLLIDWTSSGCCVKKWNKKECNRQKKS